MSSVRLIWKRSDWWAKMLGAPREEFVGEFWSEQQAHDAVDGIREKLLCDCKSQEECKEIVRWRARHLRQR